MDAAALFQDADFATEDVEAAAPERTESWVAAVLVEVAGVAEFEAVVGAFGN